MPRYLADSVGWIVVFWCWMGIRSCPLSLYRSHMLVGPVLVGPVLVGPVLVGPVLVGPVLVGPVLVGPVLVGPVLEGSISGDKAS
jgi:hypothetical protein